MIRSMLKSIAVLVWGAATAVYAATGSTTITCNEQDVGGGKKEITCTFAPIKLIVPSSLSLPAAGNGNQFDLTAGSSGFSCAPSATAVPGGSTQTSTLAANCTGSSLPTDLTWAATSPTAGTAVSLQIADPKAASTTASLNFPSTTASIGLTLTACQSAGVGCVPYNTSIANSTSLVTPTGCQLTGAPSSTVAADAAVNLGVTGCQGLQAGATYQWTFNSASVGQTSSLSHVPFPTANAATSGVYLLRVCNPGGSTTVGCMAVPSANGLTVNRTPVSGGGELALCPAGTTIRGTINLATENFKGFPTYADSGEVPGVFKVILPTSLPAGDLSARIVWNSSIGASTGKTVSISRGQACGTVGASVLGDRIDAGGKSVRYSTAPTTLPYFDMGSTWYIMVTSPGCSINCNYNLEVYK